MAQNQFALETFMNSKAPIRILAADDHPLLREGIASLIGTQPDMRLVAEAATGREAIEQFRAVRPDVALLDIQMPETSGIDALIAIRGEFPTAKVIILTTYGGDALAQRALKAGAYSYVLKGLVRKDLLETIRAAHVGQRRIHPQVASELAAHLGEDTLSDREIEVLTLVAGGNSNKEIGGRLSITEETVKAHLKRIIAKLLSNVADLETLELLVRDYGMVVAEARSLSQLAETPWAEERGLFYEADVGVRVPAAPFRFSSSDIGATGRVPRIGENTREVLEGLLGLSSAEVDQLAQLGAIRTLEAPAADDEGG